jgi:hypothetical protein
MPSLTLLLCGDEEANTLGDMFHLLTLRRIKVHCNVVSLQYFCVLRGLVKMSREFLGEHEESISLYLANVGTSSELCPNVVCEILVMSLANFSFDRRQQSTIRAGYRHVYRQISQVIIALATSQF